MTPWLRIAALAAAALSLAACSRGSVSEALGLGKRSPDEFAVVRNQPLVMPPDFQLRPPGPGTTRPAAGTPGERARANLTGQAAQPQLAAPAAPETRLAAPPVAEARAASGPLSEGTSALLARTNRGATDPEIRTQPAQENEAGAVEDALFSRLLDAEQTRPANAAAETATGAGDLSTNRGEEGSAGEAPVVVRRGQTPLGELVER